MKLGITTKFYAWVLCLSIPIHIHRTLDYIVYSNRTYNPDRLSKFLWTDSVLAVSVLHWESPHELTTSSLGIREPKVDIQLLQCCGLLLIRSTQILPHEITRESLVLDYWSQIVMETGLSSTSTWVLADWVPTDSSTQMEIPTCRITHLQSQDGGPVLPENLTGHKSAWFRIISQYGFSDLELFCYSTGQKS